MLSGWLQQRDAAPMTALAEWLKDGIHNLMPAKKYLDEGGPTAELAVLALKVSSEAVLLDQSITEKMSSLVAQYREAKERLLQQSDGKGELAALANVYSKRADSYQQLVDSLGETPPEPTMTKDERDAMTLLHFRKMKADLGLRRPIGETPDGQGAFFATCGPKRGRSNGRGMRSIDDSASPPPPPTQLTQEQQKQRIEELLLQLFKLHDLKSDGLLEEGELVKLNEKVAMLHYGKDTDKSVVKAKYTGLFRENLDPDGKPVPFAVFRQYMLQVLTEIDPDLPVQEMMLEQFCAEAESAREAFQLQSFMSATDAPFMPQKSFSRDALSLRETSKKSSVEQPQLQLPVSTKQQRQSSYSSSTSRRSADRNSESWASMTYPGGSGFVPPTASCKNMTIVEPQAVGLTSVAEEETPASHKSSGRFRGWQEPIGDSGSMSYSKGVQRTSPGAASASMRRDGAFMEAPVMQPSRSGPRRV